MNLRGVRKDWLRGLDEVLVPVLPSRADFAAQMNAFDRAVQECENDIVEGPATYERLRRFRRSRTPDCEMEILAQIRKNIQASFAQGSADSARSDRRAGNDDRVHQSAATQ
jgi:hypothetical protein